MSSETQKEIEKTLLHWARNTKRSQRMHYVSAEYYTKLNMYFGVPVATLTMIIGASVFLTIESEVALNWKIAAGLLSILAGVLSGLQTFMGFSEKAAKHNSAASGYGAIKRKLEELIILIKDDSIDHSKFLSNIREHIDNMAKISPQPPKFIHRKIMKELPGKKPSEYFPKEEDKGA